MALTHFILLNKIVRYMLSQSHTLTEIAFSPAVLLEEHPKELLLKRNISAFLLR